jgi:hypothetical protein
MNYKLSKLAIGLVAVCAFSGQASATVVNVSNLNSGSPITSDYSQGLSDSFSFSKTVANTFSDNYLFSVGSSLVDFTATTGNLLGVKNLTLSLYGENTAGSISTANFIASSSGLNSLELSGPLVTSYTYYDLVVSGGGKGKMSYGGSASISPVPEPTEGALLLSGLGLLGFIAARRKNV